MLKTGLKLDSIIFLLSIFFIHSALGAIPIRLADNAKATVKISNRALTRIFVKQDTIESVRGLEGAYILTKDEKAGEIYIFPTKPFKNKPFNIFLNTHEGRHFNLSLIPLNISSNSIELIPLSSGKSADHFEKANFYEQTLVSLIQSLELSQVPEGYVSIRSKTSSFSWPWNAMKMNLQEVYQGKELQAEKFQIENQSSKSLDLTELRFFQPGTLAIALEKLTLAPRQKTFLYRVIRYE